MALGVVKTDSFNNIMVRMESRQINLAFSKINTARRTAGVDIEPNLWKYNACTEKRGKPNEFP